MARYHINDRGEVRPCRAKPGNCRFGGASGTADHFESAAEARVAADKKLQKSYGAVASVARPLNDAQFRNLRDDVQSALVTYGGVPKASDLDEVRSVDDMVQKWFAGDAARLKSFRRLMRDTTMDTDTKKSVASFINKGMAVNTTDAVEKLQKTDSADSDIELLDEPVRGMSLDAIRAGNLRAF